MRMNSIGRRYLFPGEYRFLLFIPILTVVFISSLHAQSYNTAMGIRLGTEWGLTFKQRLANRLTGDIHLTNNFKPNGGSVDLLVQQHNPLISNRINIYYGGGLQVGWKNQDFGNNTTAGLNIVGGAEITLARINISWDLIPTINLYNMDRAIGFNSAVSVRYVIVKKKWEPFEKLRKKNKKKKKERARKRAKRQKEKKGNKPFNLKSLFE